MSDPVIRFCPTNPDAAWVFVPEGARRLWACFQACQGIPTEELEALRPGDIALALGVRALGQLNAVMRGEEP